MDGTEDAGVGETWNVDGQEEEEEEEEIETEEEQQRLG